MGTCRNKKQEMSLLWAPDLPSRPFWETIVEFDLDLDLDLDRSACVLRLQFRTKEKDRPNHSQSQPRQTVTWHVLIRAVCCVRFPPVAPRPSSSAVIILSLLNSNSWGVTMALARTTIVFGNDCSELLCEGSLSLLCSDSLAEISPSKASVQGSAPSLPNLGLYYGNVEYLPLGSITLSPWKKWRRNKNKPIRVYMDGCFDMMHYGHCNALRQARNLGDQLVVGVVSDAEITANKGPPVTPLNERMIMVSAVKWVDEVIPDAPYAITEEFMKKLFVEYNIDYIIHGDDPCLLPDGTDAYALAKKAGRYKQIKRTEGVSSTDIVGRMLLCMRERSSSDSQSHSSLQRQFSHGHRTHSQKSEDGGSGSGTRISHFLPTSRRIVQFSNGKVPIS
ncbi:phosphorylethanolamine cytidylyltransferase 1 [Actinidia rufa]|uniref:ethanolamine-phosphate cytidylyltransferase n=1 Tax=Actinidia rufa TaxID=165716 RepID=A0A7J0F3F1_9ERIC|nr:phosphorylethanolamine cytidylyltransferase 1 [Actinidia rufa]